MKEEDKNIDELVASLVNRVPVDMSRVEDDWNTIKKQLTEKKRRRFIWWWFLLGGFVAMGMTYYIVGSYSSNVVEVYNVKNSLVTPSVFPLEKEFIKEENNEALLVERNIDLVADRSSLLEEKNKSSSSGSDQSSNYKSSSIAIKQHIYKGQQETNVEGLKKKVLNDIKLKRYKTKRAVPIDFMVENQLASFYIEDSLPPENQLDKKKILNAYFEPIYVQPRYNSIVTNEIYKPIFSYSSGINFETSLNKRLSLLLGTSFSILGYNYTSFNPIEGGNPVPAPAPDPGLGLASFDANNNSEYIYRAQYLNIQTGVAITFLNKRKWRLSTVFSPEINILLSEKGSENYASKLSSSINLGFRVQYKMAKSLNLFIQPNYKYMYLGYQRKSEIPIKSYVYGLRTGIGFKF